MTQRNNGYSYVSPFDDPVQSAPQAGSRPPRATSIQQDIAGAVGLTLVVGVIMAALGFDAWAVVRWAGSAGLLALGAMLIWTAKADEWAVTLERAEAQNIMEGMAQQIDVLRAALAAERAAHEATRRDRDTTRFERDQLRKDATTRSNYTPRHDLYTRQQLADADTLLQLWEQDGRKWTGRDRTMERLRWDKSRWDAAYEMLRDAGIVETRHKSTVVKVSTYDQALATLNEFAGGRDLDVETLVG